MFVDVQIQQLKKSGEELCGDSVAMYRGKDETFLVLADGLGSGVKANILSTLTQKIALTMFREHRPVFEVVETIAATLPTCKVRELAYSTFTVIRVGHDGEADLVEFDNPETFIFKSGMLEQVAREERQVGKFTLRQTSCRLEEGDYLVAVSDGMTHAGIGGREPLGWRWDPIGQHLEAFISQDPEAEEVALNLIDAANNLYRGHVGDDASVAVAKCRPFREVVLAVGPPAHAADDRVMAERLMASHGRKIVCGGTTAKLIAREIGQELLLDLQHEVSRELPPSGKIAGIDLVTEGVITIMHCIDALDAVRLYRPRVNVHDLAYMYGKSDDRTLMRDAMRQPAPALEENPAETLARYLRLADRVTLLLGCALNPAHQNPELPMHLGLKFHLVDHLAQKLQARGKEVEVIKYA